MDAVSGRWTMFNSYLACLLSLVPEPLACHGTYAAAVGRCSADLESSSSTAPSLGGSFTIYEFLADARAVLAPSIAEHATTMLFSTLVDAAPVMEKRFLAEL